MPQYKLGAAVTRLVKRKNNLLLNTLLLVDQRWDDVRIRSEPTFSFETRLSWYFSAIEAVSGVKVNI
jgi:hypothetical protein